MMLFMMLVFEFVNLFWHPDADKGVGGKVMLNTDRCGYREGGVKSRSFSVEVLDAI